MTAMHAGDRGRPDRFALIEAVRGLASIMVVWSHSVEISGDFYTYVFDPGKIGVVIFFFISGYLVIPSAARDRSPSRFIIKRVTRLYPLYWVSLAGAFLLWPDNLGPVAWLANLTMAQQLLGFENAINVYWTLTIEVCLYVLVTAALLVKPAALTDHAKKILLLLGLICIVVALARMGLQKKIPAAIPLGLFCMFTGARLRELNERNASILPTILLYIAVVVPSCLMAYSTPTIFNETPSRYIITYLASGAIFLLVIKYPRLNLGRAVRALGDYSYGVYLFHPLIIALALPYLDVGLPLFIVALVASAAISAPLYHFLEKPAAEAGRALSKRVKPA